MQIIEDVAFKNKLVQKIAAREFHGERTGVHSSDIIYCLNKQALRRLQPIESTEKEVLIFSIGWAIQRWLTGEQADEPEKVVDGIIVTCDELLDDGTPWELKATYQSANRDIRENMNWVRQIMAQCYVQSSTTAHLSRFELMGNWSWVYTRPTQYDKVNRNIQQYGPNWADHPTLHAYRLEFTQKELDDNWAWMTERRDLFSALLDGGPLLPKVIALPPGQAYECEYCPYTEQCNKVK